MASNGATVRLPVRAMIHVVAARYGVSPEAVREWPASDYLDACSFLGVTK